MKIILNADVDKLGHKGDLVDVSAGYARNFLLPRKLAMAATKGAVKQAESMRRSREVKDQQEKAVFEQLAGKIAATPLSISVKAGAEGQMFGSVTASDIAELLTTALGDDIDRRKVQISEPIKSTGTHEFGIALRPDVLARGTIEVVSEGGPIEPEAQPEPQAEAGTEAEGLAAEPEAARSEEPQPEDS